MRGRLALAAVAALVAGGVAAAGVAGCGSDDEATTIGATTAPDEPSTTTVPGATTSTDAAPNATAPAATAPPPDVTAPPAGAGGGTPAPPEEQEGGAGDEEAARVPVTVEIPRGGRLRGGDVAIPAFFAIELRVVNRDDEPHTVKFRSATVRVAARDRERRMLEGLGKGRYPVLVDGRRALTVRTGAEAGP